MTHIEFHNKNLLSFLSLLESDNDINDRFYDKLFHFNRLNNVFLEEKMSKDFIFSNYEVIDNDLDDILKTLKFYDFIDDNNNITPEGKRFLKEEKSRNEWFCKSTKVFEQNYNGETAFQKSCVNGFEENSVNCFYCDCSNCNKKD